MSYVNYPFLLGKPAFLFHILLLFSVYKGPLYTEGTERQRKKQELLLIFKAADNVILSDKEARVRIF